MRLSLISSILAPNTLALLPSILQWCLDLQHFRCSPAQQMSMTNMPSSEEITKFLFKLNPNKAPGLDGLTSAFFKFAWNFVGHEVIEAVKRFFSTGFLPRSTNATILALVPKKLGSTLVKNFRHIACCNTIYNLISKLLVHRLKPIMPQCFLPNQTAFVQGRVLIENTLLASEIVQGYQRKRGPKRITIKVDIAKAFDTII